MKTKRFIAAALTAVLLMSCFSACSDSDKISDGVTDIVETSATENSEKNVEPYVSLEETDTGFGLMTIPKFSETMLNKESAAMANKMFADISNDILENIEEFKASTEDAPSKDEQAPALSTVKTAIIGTTLSVLTEYNYYFSAPQEYFVALNFNTETGEVINPREVVKFAEFTEDEVKAALRSFADRNLFDEWEQAAYAELADTKSLPDGWGDPSPGWMDTLDDMVREYEAEPQPLGEEWDELLRFPTVFVDENASLFVCANIPTSSESGYWTTMVQIGHSDAETLRLNPVDRNGVLYKSKGAMNETAAFEAVTYTMGLDEDGKDSDGIKYEMEAEYIDSLEGADGVFSPAYIIKVYTDQGTHISTVDRYAVGVFTGTVWVYDVAADEWSFCPNGTGFLPEDIYTGMQQDAILASVYNEPNALEEWCVPMVDEVDLIAYDTGKSYFEVDYETSIVIAKTDNTQITFVSGTMNGDEFVKQSELYSLTIDSGEGVLVRMQRPEGLPSQAIIVEAENDTGCDSGTYVVRYSGQDGTVKTEYITSDSAMG